MSAQEATSITVTTEADFSALANKPFQAGDLIRIDARADVTQSGLSEYAEIDDLLYDGDELTITLTAGLANSYAAGVRAARRHRPWRSSRRRDRQGGYGRRDL
ncbi:MAG: hypothetical protein MZV65_00925 [Chromatiales bacterium]|nr:hypothetical protein [Chromatiales bacterium]